jgi:serine/threonine-protein kinase RsbW
MKMTFEASMDYLHPMLQFVRIEIRAAGFEGLLETQVELALEEAIVNIIKHGYEYSSGDIEIHCIRLPHAGIKVILMDSGIPYNPLLNVKEIEIESRKDRVGGFGIHLILTIMNQVDYEYKDGRNILSLTKFFENKKSATNS